MFRYIQLPKLRGVLMIAVLLRFMDSFMIYTEPFVLTGGGPGNATTFLSQYLTQKAVGQFDLGPGGGVLADLLPDHPAAVLRALQLHGQRCVRRSTVRSHEHHADPQPLPSPAKRREGSCVAGAALIVYLVFALAAHLLDGEHEPARRTRRSPARSPGCPSRCRWANYATIFTDPAWYAGYINSHHLRGDQHRALASLVALPAAYAFSRYSFLGDKHVFFWLLTNRMTPPAVFLLPFFQLYTTLGLMDTHLAVALAHLVFNVPLAVWILEGFMSAVPREIDETAYIDGYSFPRFFLTIFLPLIKAGVGVTAFFCFMFSWVELLLARTLTSVNAKPIVATMTRTVSASGMDWGMLAAAGVLTIVPGALVIWFVRHYIAKGFAMGRV